MLQEAKNGWLFKNIIKIRVERIADVLEEWHGLWNEGDNRREPYNNLSEVGREFQSSSVSGPDMSI